MKTVQVALGKRSYNIFIANSTLQEPLSNHQVSSIINNRACLIVSDVNVAGLYLEPTKSQLKRANAGPISQVVFKPGETSKCLQTLEFLYAEAVKIGIDRHSVVVALGGGVVGDIAGFLAATYMRGLDLIQIPTSLVAQVDSSVGGKTGVDLPQGKNLVGSFYQPKSVLIDVAMLATLPKRQLRCGLAEVVKYGIILDLEFFKFLETHAENLINLEPNIYERIVVRCCELKAHIVINDEQDKGIRAILNYGHTFGHALEKLTGYSGLTHGEAISIGMGMAADLALLLNEQSSLVDLIKRQDALLNTIGLPTKISGHSVEEIFCAMQTDKKFTAGKKRFILPQKLGHAGMISDIPDNLVRQAIGGRCDV